MCADILCQSQPPWDFSQSKTVGFWPTLLSIPAWVHRTSSPYQQPRYSEGLSSFFFFPASFEVRPVDLAGCLLDERMIPQGKLSFSSSLCSLSQMTLSSQSLNGHEHSHFLQNYCPLFSCTGKTCQSPGLVVNTSIWFTYLILSTTWVSCIDYKLFPSKNTIFMCFFSSKILPLQVNNEKPKLSTLN